MEFDYNQSLLSFMQTGTRPKNLMFDASLYKANREVSCVQEPERQLNIPWVIAIGLLSSFAVSIEFCLCDGMSSTGAHNS